MKKLLVLVLLSNFCIPAYNKIIGGTILDKNTNRAIDFATIYISGTFLGTYSGKDGKFELDISKYATLPVTISTLGYYSVSLTKFPASDKNIIYMMPKIFELDEVVINDKSLKNKRKNNLKQLKNAFFGLTPKAGQCKIINENDITLNYNSDKDTLKAFASKPILIENKALGYRITYFLDKFELYKRNQSFYFIGNIIFNEDFTNDKSHGQFSESRRRAYLGSRMHFFRALWSNTLDANGFAIRNSVNLDLYFNNLVIQEDSLFKYIKYSNKLGICYNSTTPTSYIMFYGKKICFDKNGYFDLLVIEWAAQMAKQRIADWLPYEYSTDN